MDPVASTIESVTVYRRGARVVRKVPLDGATTAIAIAGLPLALDDGSIRVQVDGRGVRALDAKVGVSIAPSDPSLLPPRDEELREARQQLSLLQAEVARIESAIARLSALDIVPRPQARKGQAPLPTPVQARLALARMRCEEAQRLGEDRLARQADLRKAERRLAELDDRAKRATSARNAREHELTKTLIVKLEGSPQQGSSLRVEYVVPGACWSPGYTLWLGQGKARLALRALVAQRSGEDWRGVRLVLSTAEPDKFVQLPELARLRIGRAQPSKAKRGWREPPEGAIALFADYDRAFGAPEKTETPEPPWESEVGALMEDALSAVPPAAPPPPPPGFGGPIMQMAAPAPMMMPLAGAVPMAADHLAMPTPIPAAAPAPARAAMPSPARRRAAPPPASFVASAAPAPQQLRYVAPPPPSPELDPDRMAYPRLRLRDPGDTGRGELRAIDSARAYSDIPAIIAQVDRAISSAHNRANISASLPPGYVLAEPAGVFDDTYTVALQADVPSDGAYHSIPVAEHEAPARMQFVCVPREASDVFRSLQMRNPLESALLPGPVDVYELRGATSEASWLLTGRMPSTPPKSELQLGLGVEQGIKVARNTTYAEQTTGLLGGGLALVHDISIELRNGLPAQAEIEVRERIPVKRKDDDDIIIESALVDPQWEPWDQEQSLQGGRRWKVTLEPGGSRKLQCRYTVKISGKNQLAGGNRREA